MAYYTGHTQYCAHRKLHGTARPLFLQVTLQPKIFVSLAISVSPKPLAYEQGGPQPPLCSEGGSAPPYVQLYYIITTSQLVVLMNILSYYADLRNLL
jgi:hypothetical protein